MTRLLIILGFVIWFGAGLAVGWRIASPADQPPGPPRRGGSFFAQQLELTPDQQKQMDAIWSPIGRGGWSGRETRMQYRRDRDAAIAALVPEDRKADYQQIIDDYNAKITAMEKQSRQTFADAVEKTKAILTPAQREKYEKLMAKLRREPGDHDRDHGHRPPPPPPEGERPEDRAPQNGPPAPDQNPTPETPSPQP